MTKQRKREYLWLFVALALFVGATGQWASSKYLDQGLVPYEGVEVRSAVVTDGRLNLVAVFRKTECQFERLSAIGAAFGETVFLPWGDLDGLPENYDREAGLQTLRISINLEGGVFDWVEVRTRHLCDGEPVDKVFVRFDNINGVIS